MFRALGQTVVEEPEKQGTYVDCVTELFIQSVEYARLLLDSNSKNADVKLLSCNKCTTCT